MRPVETILEYLRTQQPSPWLVAIAGIPGSGKSTIAAQLSSRLPGSVVVPMDGYHLPRSQLTADQLERRGAADTFDSVALKHDLEALRQTRAGLFPSFDHAVKDPQPGMIAVTPSATMVIVEGLYLLTKSWNMVALFDGTIFLDCDLATALDRVALRHLAAGIATSMEVARHRANTIDRCNAEWLLADGSRERACLKVA